MTSVPRPISTCSSSYFATYPYYSDAIWYLTQMRRWGQIAEAKDDAWYAEMAKKVYRPDIYLQAAEALVAEGKAKKDDFPCGQRRLSSQPTAEFIDGIEYDGRKPNAYLSTVPADRPQGQAGRSTGNEVVGG